MALSNIYILIRVCDYSSGLHGPLIANPSGCLKTMWASHVTSRVKVCLYNEIRTHQPILFPHRSGWCLQLPFCQRLWPTNWPDPCWPDLTYKHTLLPQACFRQWQWDQQTPVNTERKVDVLIYLAVMTCNNKIGGALFEDFYVIWCHHVLSTLLSSLYPCVAGFG